MAENTNDTGRDSENEGRETGQQGARSESLKSKHGA